MNVCRRECLHMCFEVSFYFWITGAGHANQKNTLLFLKLRSPEKAPRRAKNAFQPASKGLL